jgi:uncharacterized protein YcfL
MNPRPTLALLLLLAAACRADREATPAPLPPDPMVALPGDAGIEAGLETLDVRTSGTAGDPANGSVLEFDLKNKTDAALEFLWSVEWYDRTGARVAGSARAWNAAKLEAGAVAACRVPMPTPEASSWRLRAVRPGSITNTQGVSR